MIGVYPIIYIIKTLTISVSPVLVILLSKFSYCFRFQDSNNLYVGWEGSLREAAKHKLGRTSVQFILVLFQMKPQ